MQVDKTEWKYILLRIDVYFNKVLLAVEIDEKGHTNSDLIFEEKKTKSTIKKLGCKFISINTSNAKNGYDLDYEVGNIETFIDEFINEKGKRTRKQFNRRKRNERETRKRNERNEKLEIRRQK